MKKVFSFLLLMIISFFVLPNSIFAQSSADWYMSGANPERTSWVSEEVNPKTSSSFGVVWYRPIEAYIDQKAQIVASNGVVYVPTARGLYALDANTGDTKWRYDTQMPIGNSPTVVNGIVYFGGFDNKIHALYASSGQQKWEFDGAGAGFSVNPVVVNGKVYAGNRDGYFYALDANSGQLAWQYPRQGQDPLGPILYSPAYKNRVIYFAANDNYAYALNSDGGNLIWKSSKLPGEGYHSWWPVIYKDQIILSAASGYRVGVSPGARSAGPFDDIHNLQRTEIFSSSDVIGPTFTAGGSSDPIKNWDWPDGFSVLDSYRVSQYLEDKPWRRNVIILNQSNGSEYLLDVDNDGKKEHAPFMWFGPKSGNRYPPILMPNKNGTPNSLLYTHSLYHNRTSTLGYIQAKVMAWQYGTKYMALTNSNTAHDEPTALSGGGNIMYTNLCCDRSAGWLNLSSSTQTSGRFWDYSNTLEKSAPGYDTMWWGADMSDEHPRLWGNYGLRTATNTNGVYHNHGDQNPFVPHQGKLFTHRSNGIIALGPNAQANKKPMLTANKSISDPVRVASLSDLKGRLEREVGKMINKGHLRPGYYNSGFMRWGYYHLLDYFENPGQTLYVLTRAYPHLNSTLQGQIKTYLQEEYNLYFKNGFVAQIGWSKGNARESFEVPPEVAASMSNSDNSNYSHSDWSWDYNQDNFYYLAMYIEKFVTNSDERLNAYNKAKSKLKITSSADYERLRIHPYEHNGYIAGYIGFLKLQELAGRVQADSSLRNQVQSELNRLTQMRWQNFEKDNPWPYERTHFRTLNIARNFILLTPDLGNILNSNAYSKVKEAVDDYNFAGPYWFVAGYEASYNETIKHHLYDYDSLFQAKALILKEPYAELYKYLDVPIFAVGDLYYINNLISTIEAGGPIPTYPNTPTPKPMLGDGNGDFIIDGSDFIIWLTHYGQSISGANNGDYDYNNKIEVADFLVWIKNYGY